MAVRASVVIATYQHGRVLREAIDSALAQTVPVEVVVVDDGSTDNTREVCAGYGARVRAFHMEHRGVSDARNFGLDQATGDFVMLLDADDVIYPNKVKWQLDAFSDDVGWVLCDVRIEDAAKGSVELASERYAYADKRIGGWIQPMLAARNFIPIMSPLVRRSVVNGLRFSDRLVPEDWHFWHEIAGRARVRYLPEVLATYRKSRTGRSRIPTQARKIGNIVQPLRLNLGCGTPGTRSWHPIHGMVNLDKSMGWTFEEGLGQFVTGSVAGITVSHSLMYVPLDRWSFVFGEFARVLAPGGVIRITEDDALDRASSRYGGWKGSQPAVTLIGPDLVVDYLTRAGLAAQIVGAGHTSFADNSLIQQQHGSPPDVFFVEGVKQSVVLLSPHCDDETLFAAFTILRHRPRVVVCFGSAGDYGTDEEREAETRDAMSVLGGDPVEFWRGGNIEEKMRDLDKRARPAIVFAPHEHCSHADHLAVATAARRVFGDRVTRYHTYDAGGKVRAGQPADFEPEWISAKLRALARYESQIKHPRANSFFTWDLLEYLET